MSNMQIFKVQLPLFSSDENALALVYNEDQSIVSHSPVTVDLMRAVGPEMKKFFHGFVREDGSLEFVDEAEWQDW